MTPNDKLTAGNKAIWQREMVSRPYGGSGLTNISNTTAYTPTGKEIYCIMPVADTVFATLTGVTGFSVTGKTGRTCPAGIPIYGRFSTVTLTSGEVDVYELETPAPV